jgi:hypothetical protein
MCACRPWATSVRPQPEQPFCRVKAGPNSREALLGIYQFYKQISPKIQLTVKSAGVLAVALRSEAADRVAAVFDEATAKLYVDVHQLFALWFAPWHRASVDLTVKLALRKEDDERWYIAKQSDFYEPEVRPGL